jgi:2-iminoacetate synthase ThiH
MIEKGRSIEYSTKEYSLKINQNDNTIIIKNKQENVYTESEVIALCKKAYSRGHYNACFKNGAEPTLSNEWINENLK